MIKSMTGFGRCEIQKDLRKFTVELKSVNHRYLDLNIRMPKKFNFFESAIRNMLKQYANRGKIDIFITYENEAEGEGILKYNSTLASEYMKVFEQIQQEFQLDQDIRVSTLARFPEVLTIGEQLEDEEELWSGLKEALEGAFEQLVSTRTVEGEHLRQDILEKLSKMESLIACVEKRAPQIISEYRAKLQEKVSELLENTQIDENRMVSEVILYADKICTDEEVVRLRSHISHMRNTLEEKDGIGRKLDFIAQEMNREANTILSKANDIEVSNYAIELKTEIEKVREQIQNIE